MIGGLKNNSDNITGGVDYDSGPYTVTFPAGVTSVLFDVPIIGDNIFEVNDRFMLTIRDIALPDSVIHGSPGQPTVTIWDNDHKQLLM